MSRLHIYYYANVGERFSLINSNLSIKEEECEECFVGTYKV
jgi:hypothetical protein